MKFWVGVGSAFGAGTLIGIGIGILLVEDKLKKEYQESSASMRRAYEAARIDAETPADLESDLVHIQGHQDDTLFNFEGGEITYAEAQNVPLVAEGPKANPYHQAVKTATLNEGFYASFAELDEEDYFVDDGRAKEQITMIYSDNEAFFFMNGTEIEDAFERVGGTIVDDVREAVRQGDPVVYMRNNQTDTDYEVLFEQP